MKLFLATAAALAAFLPLSLGQEGRTGANLAGCVPDGEYDPTTDYFPDKTASTESLFWDIQYFNSYKILRNELAGETFVLYQCGTPIPEDQINVGHLHFIPVPLMDGIALSSTTHVPHLELLGLRTEIKAYIGGFNFISSPCLNTLIDQGAVTTIGDGGADEAVTNSLKETIGPNIVSFHNNRVAYPSSLFNVTVSAAAEASNEAIYEWNKFFAVFFNMEKKANDIFDETSERYKCVAEESIDIVDIVDGGIKPTVVWAAYTNFTGVDGWSVAQCPNYYCEYASLCSADLVNSRDGTIEFFATTLFTTEAFAELAKDAEYWIYPSGNYDAAYAAYGDVLDTFKSVQAKKVFDNEKSGSGPWFENRLVEYDVVLQDFCSVVGTGDFLHERVWLRNVFTESKGSVGTECPDVSAPLETRATPCRQVVFVDACFAGDNQVELESGASIFMKDLMVGDRVKTTADGNFESVYTFGHYQQNGSVKYLQIFAKSLAKPLEITADHLVYVNGKDAPVPAGSLVVGDALVLDTKHQSATITKIKQVTREGAYAPFTASGSIVVNNVVASSYLSFESGAHLTIGGMPVVSYHWVSHLTQAPHRLYCSLVMNGCEGESYNDQGLNVWTIGPLHAAQWWLVQNVVLKSILISLSLCLLLLVAGVEALLNNSPWVVAAAVGTVGVLVHKNKISFRATAAAANKQSN